MKLISFSFVTVLAFLSMSQASARQCTIVYQENGVTLRTFQGFGQAECDRIKARCKRRAARNNGSCRSVSGGGGGIGMPTPPTRPTRPIPPRNGGYSPYDIQVGDTVYPLSWDHALGARVLQYNHMTNKFKVRSNSSGNVYTFGQYELSVGQGCLDQLCVGDTVHPSSWDHALGARIFAINKSSKKFMVKSNSSGNVYTFNISELSVGTGCHKKVCVGDKVFPLSWDHSLGAQVIALDIQDSYADKVELKVKSNSSGKVYTFMRRDIALPQGCMDGFCVGDQVYPSSWQHALGGNILAINKRQGKFVIKSNSSGKVYTMTSYDL